MENSEINVIPMRDDIIVKRDPELTESKEGIIITEKAQDKTHTGTVLAVGRDVKGISKGDKVLHLKYAGVEVGGKNVARIKADEIIAVLV